MITKRQKQVLDFIKQYTKENRYSPSLEEMAEHLDVKSVSTVHEHLQNLENGGYLHKENNQPRSIEIVKSTPMVQIPLLGEIAAGQPLTLFDQEKETIAVPKHKLPRSGNVFALKVVGGSMIDENINDGDIILVKQQNVADNGQKVVALLNNEAATVKKYYKERGQIRLQPANKNHEPIIVKRGTPIEIQGVVVDVIRNGNQAPVKILKKKERPIKKYDKLPLNKIILGDAIKELKKMPNECCNVIIADPPYNIGKDFGNNHDKRELLDYVSWCNEWIRECIRVLKPTGTMFIYGFSEILAHLSVEIPINKRWLIWHYTNKNVASLNFWQRSHEAIICAWKDKPIFNRDEVREPYTEGFLNGAAGKVRAGTAGRFSKNGRETIYKAHKNGALPRDVIKTPALAGGAGMNERWFLCKTCNDVYHPKELKKHDNHETIKHPTQKPMELTKKLIRSAAPKKEGIVLIPFVGSGSECVVAKELSYNFIGFELNPDYVKMAKKWLIATKTSPELF